jgi:histone deacetylase 1/2
LAKLHKLFYGARLKKNMDPDIFITSLEDTRARMADMQSMMTDDQFILHVLNNLTDEYETLVEIMEKRIGSDSDPIDIEDIREDLSLKFERIQRKHGHQDSDSDEEEHAMFAGGQFKGRCNACGKYGHKSAECRSKSNDGFKKPNNEWKAGGTKTFQGKCFYCQKIGHRANDCRKKKSDNGEHANSAISKRRSERTDFDDESEVVLTAIEVEDLDESEIRDVALMAYTPKSEWNTKVSITKDTWLGDSAASTHMGHCDAGMFDVEVISSPVKIGNGKLLTATKIGKKRITAIQKDGSSIDMILEDYKFVPELWVNLFSISKALKRGWNIGNKGTNIFLTKGQSKIVFDKEIKTQKGLVLGIEMVPRNETVRAGIATIALERGKTIDVHALHNMLGHPSEDTTRKTAAFYGWVVTGTFSTCVDCAIAKSKQRNVQRESDTKSTVPGERLFIDISSVKKKSIGGSKYWLLVLDDCTDYCWSKFLHTKSGQVDWIVALIKHLKVKDERHVRFIRCDNAGENLKLQQACAKEALGIQFEYTSPGSPQFNGRVERKFPTLYSRVRSALNGARLPTDLRDGLWPEAARNATDMENVMVTSTKVVASHNQFFETEMPGLRNTRTFGEIAIVNDHAKRKKQGKLVDRGRPCLLLGRAKDHFRDVYRFLNLKTRKIIQSRDVLWLNKSYGDWKELPTAITRLDMEANDPDYEFLNLEDPTQEIGRDSIQAEAIRVDDDLPHNETPEMFEQEADPAMNPRVAKEMKRLGGFFNPVALSITQRVQQAQAQAQQLANETAIPTGRDDEEVLPDSSNVLIDRFHPDFRLGYDYAMLATEATAILATQETTGDKPIDYETIPAPTYKDVFENPATYNEAWNNQCEWQRIKWRAAIATELKKMDDLKVWKKIKRSEKPDERRCVKCKWIFEIKRSGIFRARLVACGYSQIPGVDFTESYSPVGNDVTIRIMLITEMVKGLESKIIDVETAFLHGLLADGEEIYMDCPDGLEHENDECLFLLKTIYGLVQAARAFFKKLIKVLQLIGFTQSKADPCLMIRRNKLGVVYMIIHVDDCYAAGNSKALADAIEGMKGHFKLKTDYLSCEIRFDKTKSKAWLGQPHLLNKLESKFREMVKSSQVYRTPGTPSYGVIRPKVDLGDAIVSEEEQTQYRSGVGMLLYLVKHSRPDISNAVRELTKCMDGASPAAFKELKRVIKFVLDTKTYGLKLEPKFDDKTVIWDMLIYTDSDWAGDKDNRISVSGFIIFLLGAPIMWRSKGQRSVSLSSSEAEFYALSEASKEIKFIVQILISMGIPVTIPIIIRVDNVGAIFMADNSSASSRTKHMDTRYHFVREFVEENFIKIIFVKSSENVADGYTKNTSGDIYEEHLDKYVADKVGYFN